MSSTSTEPGHWADFLDALAATLEPGAVAVAFSGSIGTNSFGGSLALEQPDGSRTPQPNRGTLGEVVYRMGYTGDLTGLTARVGADGSRRLTLYRPSPGVDLSSFGGPIASV